MSAVTHMGRPIALLTALRAAQAVMERTQAPEAAETMRQSTEAVMELIGALADCRARLDDIGLIDTYIDFDAAEKARQRADAILARVNA